MREPERSGDGRRQICQSGSEGGAGQINASFLPLSFWLRPRGTPPGAMRGGWRTSLAYPPRDVRRKKVGPAGPPSAARHPATSTKPRNFWRLRDPQSQPQRHLLISAVKWFKPNTHPNRIVTSENPARRNRARSTCTIRPFFVPTKTATATAGMASAQALSQS